MNNNQSVMDKFYVSTTATQTEQLTSPILWHCLHIVKSVPEFKNLSYRVTSDMNGNELLIVYRDQVTRVFGPPVEPISLTLDPFGKCLVSIPFRPIQSVLITKSKTGHLELMSLHALFHMAAGKGFYFCPGIPEKFLAGKPCGKFVVMHRTPFKRFNAVGCVVYFQIPKAKEPKNVKVSQQPIRTLCPRCRQVAKWLQTLPVAQNQSSRPQLVNPVLLSQIPVPVPVDRKSGNSLTNEVLVGSNKAVMNATHDRREKDGIPLTVFDQTKSGQKTNKMVSSFAPDAKNSSTRPASGDTGGSRKRGMTSEKLQAVSESLRQLLRQRTMSNNGLIESNIKFKREGIGLNRGDKSPGSDRARSPRREKTRRNVCRICNKQFSSNLKLSKHVQRHEGSASNLSRRKIPRHNATAVYLSRLLKRSGSKSALSLNGQRGNVTIPTSSLQLILKSLYDIADEKKNNVNNAKITPEQKRINGKRKKEQAPQQKAPSRPGLHRSGSGLVGVQTLLSAAELAEIDQSNSGGLRDVNNFPIQGSHGNMYSPIVPSDTINNTEHTPTGHEGPSQAKKARQSLRLATKRANKRSKTSDSDISLSGGSNTPSDEAIMLTNLNLLSTVSLEAERRDNRASPGHQLLSYAGNPDSKMHNTSHNPKVIDLNTLSQSQPSNSVSIFFSTAPSLAQPQGHSLKSRYGTSLLTHQTTSVTAAPKQDTTTALSNLPPIPPLILGTDNILFDRSSHSSTQPSMHLPLSGIVSQGHNLPKALVATSGSMNFHQQEVVSSGCEAMDLTKPKPSPSIETGSSGKVSPVSQDSTDVLKHFMMINPVPPPQKPVLQTTPVPELSSLVSTKEADDSLQARIFASAKNYKLDSSVQPAGQVQAVIASSSTPAAGTPKQSKEKDKSPSNNEKNEIQCGYKWSGSGGLVKERTQLVRELVPSVVMANILNGPVSNSGLPKMDDPISAPVQNITKLRGSQKQQLPQNLNQSASSPYANQTLPSSRPSAKYTAEVVASPATPQYVLNLSKNRKDQDAHSLAASSQLPVKTPLTSLPASILRTSLLNSTDAPLKQSVASSSAATVSSTRHSSKTSVLAPPPHTVLSSSSTVIPNSSLAAMLRHSQKGTTSLLSTKSPNVSYSVTISPSVVPIISNYSSNNLEVTEIKTEPPDIFEHSDSLAALPVSLGAVIKTEDRMVEAQSPAVRDLASPPNLVVDMEPVPGGKSSKKSTKTSRGKVSTVSYPIKCEFCSQLFHSSKDHSRHVCPQKRR